MKIKKLLELIEPTIKNLKTSRYFKDRSFDYRQAEKDPNILGAGYFSKVRKTSDPHLVKKSSIYTTAANDEYNDAYWDYIDFILKHKLWENPHFPRVYVRTSLSGKYNTQHNSVHMEKLEPLDTAGEDVIIPMARIYMSKQGLDFFRKKLDDSKGRRHPFSDAFSNTLEYVIKTGDTSLIKNEQLKKALKILHSYSQSKGVQVDLHSENIMGRRTPIGLQLVIADPFSFKKATF